MSTLFDTTLGALFIGVFVSAIIYGITFLQVFMYFTSFSKKDRLYLKAFIAALWALDTTHLALTAHSLYFYTITSYCNIIALEQVEWSIVVQVPVGGLVAACVQAFFAYRIYIVSARRALPICILIGVIICAEMVTVIVFAYKSFVTSNYAETYLNKGWFWGALGSELAADTIVTASMVFYLQRNKSHFHRTNSVLTKLVLYFAQTGILISICAIGLAITYAADPNTLRYTPFFFILIRLYPCSFMSQLNARQSIRAQLQQPSFVLPSRSSGPDGVTTGAGTGASRTMQGGIVFANSHPEASFERPASLELMDDMPKAEGVA